ncbi:MAG: hypothetical protein QE487_04200 [Fluviicola sp.]|nr:hypothetical protein [Fluviicola sp.]
MNPIVRIRPFDDSLFGESGSRFPEFFRERMRLFSITVMPLLMSCGLIVDIDPGLFGKDSSVHIPKHYEYHWFAVFVENYGIVPVILIALVLLALVFLLVRFLIKTIYKRNNSDKMNHTK